MVPPAVDTTKADAVPEADSAVSDTVPPSARVAVPAVSMATTMKPASAPNARKLLIPVSVAANVTCIPTLVPV